jgi:transcriptional regulator with XRE-family HTH domain
MLIWSGPDERWPTELVFTGGLNLSEVIGSLVARARDAAGLTQKELADRMSVNQSRISRIEAGEATSGLSFYVLALHLINTPEAITLAEAIRLDWQHLPKPSFTHPDLTQLIEIERALSRLFQFKQAGSAPSDILGQADLLLRRLQETAAFLIQLDHQISYVGEIGIGKTTAVCTQSGLVLNSSDLSGLKGMMLDTGGGRTTLCDVVIQKGDRYAFFVDPLADEEVYRLAGELCQSSFEAKKGNSDAPSAPDYRPPEEVARALRNMSGLLRIRKDRNGPLIDPLSDLAARSSSLGELQTEFASKLTLWRRTRKEIEFDGGDDFAGRRWFRETFTAINNGRHPDFSIPGKITATVPFYPAARTPFNVTLLDTRGIDGSPIRADIVSHLKNERTLTVLCSKWGSAPDPAVQTLLRYVIETEVDLSILRRFIIMIIARSGDALSMRSDSGEHAANPTEGYDIKILQAHDALDRERLPTIEMFAFDAAADDGANAVDILTSKISSMRTLQSENARATIAAVDQMLENSQLSRVLIALRTVNNEIKNFAEKERFLKQDNSRIHSRLMLILSGAHPRTIWASVRRQGSYWNFDFYQHLGDGAAAEAKRQHFQSFERLRDVIRSKIGPTEYHKVQRFLEQLLADVTAWENDFIRAVQHNAIATYKSRLSKEPIWEDCEKLYGQGPYRDRVVKRFDEWFAENEDVANELDLKFQLAWQRTFIEPLLRVAGEGLDST